MKHLLRLQSLVIKQKLIFSFLLNFLFQNFSSYLQHAKLQFNKQQQNRLYTSFEKCLNNMHSTKCDTHNFNMWSFVMQCSAKNGNQILDIFKRTVMSIDKEIIMRLCKSMIHPHLKYCIQVWKPFRRKQRIQKQLKAESNQDDERPSKIKPWRKAEKHRR